MKKLFIQTNQTSNFTTFNHNVNSSTIVKEVIVNYTGRNGGTKHDMIKEVIR